jgi:hypothetical protein
MGLHPTGCDGREFKIADSNRNEHWDSVIATVQYKMGRSDLALNPGACAGQQPARPANASAWIRPEPNPTAPGRGLGRQLFERTGLAIWPLDWRPRWLAPL